MDLTGLLDPARLLEYLAYNPEKPMLFNSGLFLFLFLAFMGIYLLVADRKPMRIVYVTAFSLFFYYKSSGFYFILLIVSTIIDFLVGILIYKAPTKQLRLRYLILSIVANLGMLAFFKYSNFFVETVNAFLEDPMSPTNIFLPVGISFFTFQTMSYTIDVYRGKLEPVYNILDFAFFVSFFPQLVAGPIVRAADFIPQIRADLRVSHEDVGKGLLLICTGLFKKAVISDYISVNFVDRIFENPALYSGFENLMGVYGYALQIYCDFSGYSDMAIGIGLLLGFRLPINFAAPYKSASIQAFWRRWHISLSTWLRDYLYISLGGNRINHFRTYLNLLITMVLGGLWHGASWKFVFWGFLHGVALAIDRMLKDTKYYIRRRVSMVFDRLDQRLIENESAPMSRYDEFLQQARWFMQGWFSLVVTLFSHVGGIIFTFHFVCFCWIFFRANSFELAWEMIDNIYYNFNFSVAWQVLTGYKEVFLLMVVGYLLHMVPNDIDIFVEKRFITSPVLVKSLSLALVIWLVIQTRSAEVQPFIYFQF